MSKPDENEPGVGNPDPKEIRLPDDHPLVTTLATLKTELAEVKKQRDANADKAKKFDDLEQANLSELEKAQARISELEQSNSDLQAKIDQAAAAAEHAKLRDGIATAKGIPAHLLSGSTKEELETHADALIKAGIKPNPIPDSAGVQGNTGDPIGSGDDMTPEEIAEAALSR